MKLAKASQSEIDSLMKWLQNREAAKFESPKNRPPAFMRVVFGYETLVNNVCDPEKDYLDWKPGMSPSYIARLQDAVRYLARECDPERNGFFTQFPEFRDLVSVQSAAPRASQSAPHYEQGSIGYPPENQRANKPSVAFGPRRP
jgi:hypothetical protein